MDFEGTYNINVKAALGSAQGEIVLSTEDGEVKGIVRAMGIEAEAQNIVIDGSSFSCEVEGDGPTGHVKAKVTGEFQDGHIKGVLKAGIIKAKFEGDRA